MKTRKRINNFKRVVEGAKFAVAGVAGAGTLALAGCTNNNQPEQTSIVEEVTTPEEEKEIEIIETADLEEEVVEVEEVKVPSKIDVTVEGEYKPETYTQEEVYNYIAKIESLADSKYKDATDYYYKRDCMISLFCLGNYNCLEQDTLNEISSEYLAKWSDSDITNGVFNGYYVNDEDYIDNIDAELFIDPVYQNEMEIFNYYLGLYLSETDETKKTEYANILNSAVYGNEYDVFPLTFDENNYNNNYAFIHCLSNKLMQFALEKYNDNDIDIYVEFSFDDNYSNMLTKCNGLASKAALTLAGSEETMIVDGNSYIPSHKGKVIQK